MLRNKPITRYCGVSVILSCPGRFDKARLLTAGGGVLFENHCIQPDFSSMQCDIRVTEDRTPFLDGTKVVLLLGERAMHEWCPQTTRNSLNELRGSPLYINGIPAIASYPPQEAADFKNHEAELNPLSEHYGLSESEIDDDDDNDEKTHGATKHANKAFWLKRDIWKAKQLLKNKLTKWPTEPEPEWRIYPPSDEVINALLSHKDGVMFIDLETDIEERNMQCFSFCFEDGKTVWSVPMLNYEYKYAYPDLPFIYRALCLCCSRNIVVAHNGAAFDFPVLAYKYHIAIRNPYDTMLTQHRIFPDIEKSLGHCISYWTYQSFHKDTDSQGYVTREQMMARLKYCARDTFGMKLVYDKQQEFIRTIPGLLESNNLVQRSIIPYMVTTLQGIRYLPTEVTNTINTNDRWMQVYNNIVECLIGETGLQQIRGKLKSKKAGLFIGSSRQNVEYFHNLLGYPVVARGKTGEPSLGKGALYKLALSHDNPVIKLINLYRATQKETGALDFNPWKDDNGKIMPWQRRSNELEDRHELD